MQKKIILLLLCIVLVALVWIRRPQHISSLLDWQNKEIAYCTIVKESGEDTAQIRLTEAEEIAAFCDLLDAHTVSFHFWYDNQITYDASQDLYWVRIFYADHTASAPISFLSDGHVFYNHIEYRLHSTEQAVITKELERWLENSENTAER